MQREVLNTDKPVGGLRVAGRGLCGCSLYFLLITDTWGAQAFRPPTQHPPLSRARQKPGFGAAFFLRRQAGTCREEGFKGCFSLICIFFLSSCSLSHCSLTVAGCWALAHALKRNGRLKILDVGNNAVQDGGVKELCGVLRSPSCVLQTLG